MISLPHCIVERSQEKVLEISPMRLLCGMPAAQQPTHHIAIIIWDRVLLLGEVFQQQSSDKEILLSLYTPAASSTIFFHCLSWVGNFKVQSTQSEDASERDFTCINATLCTSACAWIFLFSD
jgi:arginine exporter protein ArgO